jgi:FkbM family methyltransferase
MLVPIIGPHEVVRIECSVTHPILLRGRNRMLREVLSRYLRPVPRPDLVRLGTSYGGWWVPEPLIGPETVAYCAGAGEDISFDLALMERGCRVATFDPTPRAIAHVQSVAPQTERFRFEPVGWWNEETELRFYAPRDPSHVSHLALNLAGTVDYFAASVRPVWRLMADLGDDHVDLIKMDIEGAEYAVIDSLLRDGPLPEVLCVEFDQPQPPRRTIAAVRRLRDAGYELNHVELWNYTFTRR